MLWRITLIPFSVLAGTGNKAVSKLNSSHSHLTRAQSETSWALSVAMPPITLTPRDAAFKQALIDAKYYPHDHGCSNNNRPLPNNLDEIHERLHERRPSLSQSRFTDDDFQHFKDLNESALTQAHAMSRIFPIIRGREAVASGQGYLFGNMDPLAENISRAIPGYFNGSYPENVRGEVRADLKMYIVPSSNDSRPLLPNFFSEVGTNPSMMERRITQVLGYGARSMYKIQSYRQGQSVFDGNAYTIGSTYSYGKNAGILRLYTMHPTGPAGPNGEPKYWTNEIMTFAMTKDADAFRNGAAAFRNAQDWAKEQRDTFIELANERVTTGEEVGEEY